MCSQRKNGELAKPSRKRIVCRTEFFAGPENSGDGGGGGGRL